MSDRDDASRLIDELEEHVTIPDEWTDFYDKRGPVGACYGDLRQFPRFHHRVSAAVAVLPTLPALRRSGLAERVYVKDISRVSVALLHPEQLFPGEHFHLILADGVMPKATVVRCRRIQARCYEVGARFITEADADDDK